MSPTSCAKVILYADCIVPELEIPRGLNTQYGIISTAALKTARQRLRPIRMTAATTIAIFLMGNVLRSRKKFSAYCCVDPATEARPCLNFRRYCFPV